MKVLIVDDEAVVARALVRVFESRGHATFSASTGEEGFEKWLEKDPDVVMLDVVMPGFTGPQVLEEMKNAKGSWRAKVVLMTAHSGVKDAEAAKALGADDFIQKPFNDIFDIVKNVESLNGERKK